MKWDEIPDWAQAVARSLLRALREKDPYTYGHSLRVARLSRLLAGSAGLNERDQSVIEFSSLFHDLGKIGVPDSVLLKPGRLTPDEEAIMRAHPVKSVEIMHPLTHIPFFHATIPGIQHHHERVDGLGYPDGLTGDAIPLASRIILVADTYDAMTTTRPYRRGLPDETAYKELQTYANRQFDPQLVEIFVHAHPSWTKSEEHELSEENVPAPLRRAA